MTPADLTAAPKSNISGNHSSSLRSTPKRANTPTSRSPSSTLPLPGQLIAIHPVFIEITTIFSRHLQIILYDAERAWAHSQLIKSTLSLPTTTSKARHHQIKRLARSHLHANQLLTLAQSLYAADRLDAISLAQITVYQLVTKGTLAFEREQYELGFETLSVAHTLLGTLATGTTTPHLEALINEMIDDIEPLIRFCAYKLSLDVSQGVENIVREIVTRQDGKLVAEFQDLFKAVGGQESEAARKNVGDIEWRGAEIKVRNAQLVDVIVKVKDVISALSKDATTTATEEKGKAWGKRKQKSGMDTSTNAKEVMDSRRMGMYDKALLVLSDAEGVARQLVEDNKVCSSYFPALVRTDAR